MNSKTTCNFMIFFSYKRNSFAFYLNNYLVKRIYCKEFKQMLALILYFSNFCKYYFNSYYDSNSR